MNQMVRTGRIIAPGASCAPTPDWVDLQPYDIPAQANPHFIAGGVCFLLHDNQIDLCETERAWFYRRAEMITAGIGAERAAQFSVNFDPNYERLEVHFLRVLRGAQVTDYTDTATFEVLRREQNLERLMFDGRNTVHFTLPDVRIGDVVESGYTLYGARKSLAGRHSAWVPFNWSVGIVETRLRQRAPKHRVIQERAFNNPPPGVETTTGAVIDRRWRTFEQQAFKYEDLAPPWALQSAFIQFSEWRDWAEVAATFTAIYDEPLQLPGEITTEIERIAVAEPSPAGRAAAMLRFVQGGVRYLAISMGEGGYTPRPLADVCSTRYGDCKDKSKLYAAMARQLGIDACPALVNTCDGYLLNDCLPTAQLFDHCIVRIAMDGKIYWLDPTRQVQPSPLSEVSQCHFGWALPLRIGSSVLERMADPPVLHLVNTQEQITLGKGPKVPVQYAWEKKYRSFTAEAVRDQFAREGAVGVFKAHAEDIQRSWPNARVVNQDITDDIASNTICVRESYEIPDAWTKTNDDLYRFQTRDLTLQGALAPLDANQRKCDIFLGSPGRRTRRVDVRSETAHAGGWTRQSFGDSIRWTDDMRLLDPKWLVIEQSLEIRRLTMPASEVEKYREIQAGLDTNELVITHAVVGDTFKSAKTRSSGGEIWNTLRIVFFVLWVLFLLGRVFIPH